jgi:hypothetical protein
VENEFGRVAGMANGIGESFDMLHIQLIALELFQVQQIVWKEFWEWICFGGALGILDQSFL